MRYKSRLVTHHNIIRSAAVGRQPWMRCAQSGGRRARPATRARRCQANDVRGSRLPALPSCSCAVLFSLCCVSLSLSLSAHLPHLLAEPRRGRQTSRPQRPRQPCWRSSGTKCCATRNGFHSTPLLHGPRAATKRASLGWVMRRVSWLGAVGAQVGMGHSTCMVAVLRPGGAGLARLTAGAARGRQAAKGARGAGL